jgi:hypothetical protein
MCRHSVAPGTEVTVTLPAGGTAIGRAVRTEGGLLRIAFRQDLATAALLDRTLEALRRKMLSAVA